MPPGGGRHGSIPVAAASALVVASGAMMASQAEINGALSAALSDPLGAALISFATGFVWLSLQAAGSSRTRAGIALAWRAVRGGTIPPWYLCAGAMGASVVLAQAVAVPVTGVAVFIVAVVAGQVVSGLVVDSFGLGSGVRRPVTALRVLAAAITALATALTASGDLASQGAGAILALSASAAAGALVSVQVACNGAIGRIAGTPWVASFFNFAVGTVVLAVVWTASRLAGSRASALPGQWWLYLGGGIGIIVIALHAWLVRRIGVLTLGVAVVTGQLGGALAIQWLVPGHPPPTAAVVVGTLVALIGAIIGTWRPQTGVTAGE
jgi:transporter family-2 protein